jgi:hypothetical protein
MPTQVLTTFFVLGAIGCRNDSPSPSPTPPTATVGIVFRGPTARRADLPASVQAACVQGVGITHTHPSWRGFAGIPLEPVPPDRYEVSFADVPVGISVSFRVNDQNWCDQNPTGAVLRNVSANDVQLLQNTLTPGSGQEPGFAFTVGSPWTLRDACDNSLRDGKAHRRPVGLNIVGVRVGEPFTNPPISGGEHTPAEIALIPCCATFVSRRSRAVSCSGEDSGAYLLHRSAAGHCVLVRRGRRGRPAHRADD